MPTKRRWTTALCTGTALIVAGGWGEDEELLMVEVMNTENHQWSTAADLPEPMYLASATICSDQICIVGGISKEFFPTKSVYTYLMSDLLQSCHITYSLKGKLEKTSLKDKAGIWRQLPDLPVTRSVSQSFHSQLLVIGGRDSGEATTAVYMYNSATNSWEIIGHMTTVRHYCFTAILPDNRLMVVGGYKCVGKVIDIVEFASVY